MSQPHDVDIPNESASPEYYYTVLNLPVTASAEDVRDRYKQLSLILHPDKQRDERLKDIASEKFMLIQKAYQVLSDPTLRKAYDLYGVEGLKLVQASELNGVLDDEFQTELARRLAHRNYARMQQITQSTGNTTMAVNASAIFENTEDDLPLHQALWHKARSIHMTSVKVRNTFKKSIGPRTTLACSPSVLAGARGMQIRRRIVMGTSFVGSLTHQLSPLWTLQADTDLLKTPNMTLRANYDDGDNQLGIETYWAPLLTALVYGMGSYEPQGLTDFFPPFSLSYGRRLFPGSQGMGSISLSTASALPALSLAFSTGRGAWDDDEESEGPSTHPTGRAPSLHGLTSWRTQWTTGVQLQGPLPSLFAAYAVSFGELGLRLFSGLDLGFKPPSINFGAAWSASEDEQSGPMSLSAQVSMSLTEISLKLKMIYYNQIIQVPITLSNGFDSTIAFWTTVVPSTSVALSYYFLLRPRQRKRRMEFFRQARRDLREATSDIVRPAEETVTLLRDAAQRQMRAEASVDGLIIADARYGPAAKDDATRGLDVDVTVPMQVLVHNSQLHIPGRRSKAGLPGFYDPAPSVPKCLRVHYTFRGRAHYAEIPDHLPAVLPLADHRVQS
ncbi:DnaJ-domain-containing protein [Trametopsis cervina]|nr:DnaJ-domain-containing protein [Trametopsis cervina]